MRELADILIKVLYEEIEVYEELYKKLDEKTEILVAGNISALDNITGEEYGIIEKISKFEKLREKVIFNIARKEELKKDITIGELAGLLEEEQKEKLMSLKDSLIQVLEKIKDKNKINATLIKDSLDYIDLNIDLLTNRDKDLTYSKGKSKKENESISLFNQKA